MLLSTNHVDKVGRIHNAIMTSVRMLEAMIGHCSLICEAHVEVLTTHGWGKGHWKAVANSAKIYQAETAESTMWKDRALAVAMRSQKRITEVFASPMAVIPTSSAA